MPTKGFRATHCKRGHPRTPENLSGKCCKLCQKLRDNVRDKGHRQAWAKRNPERSKAMERRKSLRRGGWTPEAVEEARAKQNNCCALCGGPFTEGNGPYADHKHTNPPKPRGLLHNNCNVALGLLRDSIQMCEAAAAYLKRWP